MAYTLPDWVDGSLSPSLLITWSAGVDLSGATITGTIRKLFGDFATRAIEGDLTVTDGANRVFRWDFAAADVVSGKYEVQFTADLPSGPTPSVSFIADWTVKKRNTVSA